MMRILEHSNPQLLFPASGICRAFFQCYEIIKAGCVKNARASLGLKRGKKLIY